MPFFIILFSSVNAAKKSFRVMKYDIRLTISYDLGMSVFENLYIDVRNYCYAHGNMADRSDDGYLLWSSIPVNNVNDISASPKTVTYYTVSYPAIH